MDIKQIDNEYIARTYARFPLVLKNGKGSLVYDETGKEYIDLGTGIAVNSFGVSDDEWVSAVTAQLTKIQHTSNLYYNEPSTMLAKELCERTGMRRVFFSNSGAEANECAIKVARKYGTDHKGEEYTTIVTLVNSFHGRTITTLSATGQDVFHKDFTPMTPGFVYAEANNIESVKELVKNNKCCALMFEIVQGEGGVLPLDADFVEGLAKIANEEDLLLIADEVQIGNGRSGKLYGYMNYSVVPDVVTTAKGLGGGLPIAATMLGEKVKDIFTPGLNGSTFGANPVCAAGALNVLSRIDEGLLADVQKKSEYIRSELEGAEGVIGVSGLGLMLGVECERDAGVVIAECIEKGVLVIKAKNKVRLLPALNIPMEQLQRAIKVLKEVLANK